MAAASFHRVRLADVICPARSCTIDATPARSQQPEDPLETARLQGVFIQLRKLPLVSTSGVLLSGSGNIPMVTTNAAAMGGGMNNQQQDDGSAQRRQEGKEPAADINAKEAQDKPAEQAANDADDNIANDAQLIVLNHLIGNGASDASDDDPDNPGPDGAQNTCHNQR